MGKLFKPPDNPADPMDDRRAGINCKRLTNRLSANCQTSHQRGHHQGHQTGPCKFKIRYDLRRNRSGSRTGNNTADIAYHIVADRAYLLSIAQKLDRFQRTRYFSCGHRMKRFFIGRCNRHTDDIEYNAQQHNGKQDHKANRNTAVCH